MGKLAKKKEKDLKRIFRELARNAPKVERVILKNLIRGISKRDLKL